MTMTRDQAWNTNTPIRDLGVKVPRWIEQDISPLVVSSIAKGGCASDAYLPAVEYWSAMNIMHDHGDDVLGYLDEVLGEIPSPPEGTSWAGMACYYLCYAIDVWSGSALEQILEPEES